jgi:hypothetical protein
MTVTAQLRDWSISQHPSGALQLWGKINGDVKGRFTDGEVVRTSALISIENGVATTRNSIYELDGAPAGLSFRS